MLTASNTVGKAPAPWGGLGWGFYKKLFLYRRQPDFFYR